MTKTSTSVERQAAERILAAVAERFVDGSTVGAQPVLFGPGEWSWPDGTIAADFEIEFPAGPDLWPFDPSLRAVAGEGVLLAPVASKDLAIVHVGVVATNADRVGSEPQA